MPATLPTSRCLDYDKSEAAKDRVHMRTYMRVSTDDKSEAGVRDTANSNKYIVNHRPPFMPTIEHRCIRYPHRAPSRGCSVDGRSGRH